LISLPRVAGHTGPERSSVPARFFSYPVTVVAEGASPRICAQKRHIDENSGVSAPLTPAGGLRPGPAGVDGLGGALLIPASGRSCSARYCMTALPLCARNAIQARRSQAHKRHALVRLEKFDRRSTGYALASKCEAARAESRELSPTQTGTGSLCAPSKMQ
jgi:hypothetical protein